MDPILIEKYFNDCCTEDELEEVLAWFQTNEGQRFLEQRIDSEGLESIGDEGRSLLSIESENLFARIQQYKERRTPKGWGYAARVASILILVASLSSLLYWSGLATSAVENNPQPVIRSYVTDSGQQNIFTLSDGTTIRLNENSMLTVPVKLNEGKRTVRLRGEAYFEVAKDSAHPFIVHTSESTIEVLGTKFNVKADAVRNNVQVAVLEGKVALKKNGVEGTASALLTRNNFGLLQLDNNRITIEKVRAENYLSWARNRLVYDGETLEQVSQQLEHLYGVEVRFATQRLKSLELTADIERTELDETVSTIAKTFDIRYTMKGNKLIWQR